MGYGLSPQNEQYLQEVVATGQFPSEEAAINAAVAALREKHERLPPIPDEDMDAVEEALAESDAGLSRPMTQDDWTELRQLIQDVADAKKQGSR